jgi:hypothetical protein
MWDAFVIVATNVETIVRYHEVAGGRGDVSVRTRHES